MPCETVVTTTTLARVLSTDRIIPTRYYCDPSSAMCVGTLQPNRLQLGTLSLKSPAETFRQSHCISSLLLFTGKLFE
jgi:hypothetical protein